MTIDQEIRQTAEEMYILEGYTLDQVAEKIGISNATVKKWSVADEWVFKRREYRRALGEIRRKSVLYRLELLEEAMRTKHPQHAFAWATVERVAAEKAIQEAKIPDIEKREIRTAQDAINALQEAIERKLAIMLSQPDTLNFKSVKEMKDAFLMVEGLKARHKTPEEKKRGLSDESAAEIRKKILGIV